MIDTATLQYDTSSCNCNVMIDTATLQYDTSSCNFNVMIDTATLYSLIPVWMTDQHSRSHGCRKCRSCAFSLWSGDRGQLGLWRQLIPWGREPRSLLVMATIDRLGSCSSFFSNVRVEGHAVKPYLVLCFLFSWVWHKKIMRFADIDRLCFQLYCWGQFSWGCDVLSVTGNIDMVWVVLLRAVALRLWCFVSDR